MYYLSDEVRNNLLENAGNLARLRVQVAVLDDLMEEYAVDGMLDRLNEACGTGAWLTLAETQEIRSFMERLIQIRRKGE